MCTSPMVLTPSTSRTLSPAKNAHPARAYRDTYCSSLKHDSKKSGQYRPSSCNGITSCSADHGRGFCPARPSGWSQHWFDRVHQRGVQPLGKRKYLPVSTTPRRGRRVRPDQEAPLPDDLASRSRHASRRRRYESLQSLTGDDDFVKAPKARLMICPPAASVSSSNLILLHAA
jgi:hypothetical protein